ncbi:endoglucanase 17 [Dorcoceras hygrometricum]|uniref:Endoglucanase n=1 Tax=Dorcoceras hygrometricum TaxID=472368 RepID=A0A2Z7CLE0_9LAMI|nr:endoglucanase 17 [Dorcoceras hygrometricum]
MASCFPSFFVTSIFFCVLVCSLQFLCDAYYPVRNYPFSGHRQPRYASHNYRDALTKSILFFEGQRSGRLPPNQRITWRKSSGLSDGAAMHVDLVGGYYDAGDNVKFGFPMAFTTTMLSWSVIEFGGLMKGELQNAKAAIRWATDYLLKATAHPGAIYVQVGDAAKDHACWERPEDMDTPRSVFKIDKNTPGTEVAAETAAALAAASLVFRRSDPNYSKILARRAIGGRKMLKNMNMFSAIESNESDPLFLHLVYTRCLSLPISTEDELLWGAAWLHKATRNPNYLSYIQANGQTLGADESDSTFGWDNKHVGARILLSKAFLVQNFQPLHEYKSHADNFICSVFPGTPYSTSQYTTGGLLFKMSDGNMQYVTSTAFLLVTYAKYLISAQKVVNCGGAIITPNKLRALAKKQVDYLLGDNPLKMSYMVGYGPRYPLRIHHRGSSLPSVGVHPAKIQCSSGFSVMSSQSPNPNLLVGAVVGGPDQNDRFPDQRSDYEQSEPATYINAPLVGALAYLAHSYGQI